MGWGDFGSNGSMHWQIGYDDLTGAPPFPPAHVDYDNEKRHPGGPPDTRPPIGQGKGGSGTVRVTLRFNDPADARRVIEQAWKNLQSAPANTKEVIIDVPIRGYRPPAQAPNPTNRSEWEVGVDW